MKTKLLSVLLAAALLLALLPQLSVTAFAAETSGKCGDSASWSYDASTGALTISGTGAVNTIDLMMGKLWAPYMDQIKSVTVKSGITEIGASAFSNAENLESVSLPDTLTSMIDMVFYHCTSLKSIDLPDSITNMGGGIFYECTSLTSLRFPTKLDTVWAQSVRGCTSLTSVTLPPHVKTIMSSAFQDCTALTEIVLPDSVEEIDSNAFTDSGIYNNAANWEDGALYVGRWLIEAKNVSTLRVKDGTAGIADDACGVNRELTEVILPDSLRYIGNTAFAGCTALKEITIPAGVKRINGYAFFECAELESVTILSPACAINDSGPSTLGIEGKTTIRGYDGSTAEAFTKKYYFPFESIGKAAFIDVAPGMYYEKPIAWAVEKGVTNGTSVNTFSPEKTCTRAQTVTFLWRANGSPSPWIADCPFDDVSLDAYYHSAVLWALEKNVTTGTSAKAFSPEKPCTRAQVVTFLWRSCGSPKPESTVSTFTDVVPGTYYSDAVLWAVENGITNGTSADKFSPESTCTRGQIVTFLYRAYTPQ